MVGFQWGPYSWFEKSDSGGWRRRRRRGVREVFRDGSARWRDVGSIQYAAWTPFQKAKQRWAEVLLLPEGCPPDPRLSDHVGEDSNEEGFPYAEGSTEACEG